MIPSSVDAFEILQVQPNISKRQRHVFICSPFMTLEGVWVHLCKPTEETSAGLSLTIISVCQDNLNGKMGKHYPVVLLLKKPLSDCVNTICIKTIVWGYNINKVLTMDFNCT